MSNATERWRDKLEWHLERLAEMKKNPDPRFQRLCAVHIPLYEKYREQFERTGQIDSGMYEMVMGNM